MWRSNSWRSFFVGYLNLDPWHIVFSLLLFATILLYPGQNELQRLVIHPGPVKVYPPVTLADVLYPQSDGVPAPATSALAVVVQDPVSKTILYSKNPDTQTLPASLTKIMTALVALDHWQDLETVVEVKNEDRAIGQTIELERGERMTLRNMLYGLLVHSGNDAALAIADNYQGGYEQFVKAMNAKATELHLDHTIFKNPSGVEQYGHTTTARDLAILAMAAIQNDTLMQIAGTKYATITDVTGTITHRLETTNSLLGLVPGLKGLKTGWTSNAGECLISYVERVQGSAIVVLVGSRDRFGESSALINWVYAHHNWIIPEL